MIPCNVLTSNGGPSHVFVWHAMTHTLGGKIRQVKYVGRHTILCRICNYSQAVSRSSLFIYHKFSLSTCEHVSCLDLCIAICIVTCHRRIVTALVKPLFLSNIGRQPNLQHAIFLLHESKVGCHN